MKSHSVKVIAGCLLQAALLPQSARSGDTASRYEQPQLLTGTIYAANSDKKQVLYKFKRTVTRAGNSLTTVREFTAPDGELAAREITVYGGDDLRSYELEELQVKAHGTVVRSRDPKMEATITFQYVSGNNTKPNLRNEALRPDTLVSDMLAPFLAAHWTDLMSGREVKCRYVAAARLETVGFNFTKQTEVTVRGRPAVIIKMSPSSFVIAALVAPIYFTMEKAGAHRVLQYDGRTTPKIRDGNKWKDLDAVTVFDWD